MTRLNHERRIIKRSRLQHLYPGSLPIILGQQKASPGSDLPFLAHIPSVPSQDIASKTKTSLRLRRFYPTFTATIAASKTRRDPRRGSTVLSTPERQFSQGGMGAIFTHSEKESLVFGMCPTAEHANALCSSSTQQQHSLEPH